MRSSVSRLSAPCSIGWASSRSRTRSAAIVVFDEQTAAGAWDAYVDRHPAASIYHRLAWKRVVEETFGKATYYFAWVDDAQRLHGVLPLVRLKGLLSPGMLISLPYCNFGGVLADEADIGVALLDRAAALADELGCSVVEARSVRKPPGLSWAVRDDKVRMVLRLPSSADELGKMLGAKRRSQIKRCARENPEVVFGGAELIPDFYAVFAKRMRDLGTPVYPRAFFENVAKHFAELVRVLVVRIGQTPAAAAFLIRFRDTMEIPWAASDAAFDGIAVNMLLYWESLRHAVATGCAAFDFGRSTRDSGPYKFKRQWGAEPEQLEWSYRANSGVRQGATVNESARVLSRLWQRLPLPVANWLGPKVTSNLPW